MLNKSPIARRIFAAVPTSFPLCAMLFGWSILTLPSVQGMEQRLNVAATAQAKADAPFSFKRQALPQYGASRAIDGNCTDAESRWISEQSNGPHFLELTFVQPYHIDEAVIYADYSAGEYGRDFVLQIWQENAWDNVKEPQVAVSNHRITVKFTSTSTTKIRYFAQKTGPEHYVKLFEFEVYASVPAPPVPLAYSMELTNLLAALPVTAKIELKNNWTVSSSADTTGVPVVINRSLNAQPGMPQTPIIYYRTEFELPSDYHTGNVLLYLGKISANDEVSVNGKVIGGYGNLQPPYKTIRGSSSVDRRYLVLAAGSPFRAGTNTLMIKVGNGYLGGMYNGIPSLSRVADMTPMVDFNLKRPGPSGLYHFLCGSEFLNRYVQGEEFGIAPKITSLGNSFQATLQIKLDGSLIKTIPVAGHYGVWTRVDVVPFRATTPGKHFCEVELWQGKQKIFERRLEFEVLKKGYQATIPVASSLPMPGESSRVNPYAMGSFGPRFVENNELVENVTLSDGRGSLSFAAACNTAERGPLLFSTNIRPTPRMPFPPGKYLHFDGKIYDGVNNTWSWGFVSVGAKNPVGLAVTASSWNGKQWSYIYQNGTQLDFSISALSPAWHIATNARRIEVLQGLKSWGLGAPTHLAWMENNTSKTGTAISGKQMGANWVLAWFNGAEGWDEFDAPWLFVMKKRPEQVNLTRDGLSFCFAAGAEQLWGMPLYGVRLLPPYRTADWSAALPPEVIERCRFWSQALLCEPTAVTRFYQVDYSGNQLLLQDRFTYREVKDDWNTPSLQYAPVPPIFPLAAAAVRPRLAINAPITDLQWPTLHGPYTVVKNTDRITYRIDGLLQLVNEVRDIAPPPRQAYHDRLSETILAHLPELARHPWLQLTSINCFVIAGSYEPGVSDLLLALPYLPEELRHRVMAEIRTEMEKYLINPGLPEDKIKDRIRKEIWDKPLLIDIKNPISGKLLSSDNGGQKYAAIDAVCWQGLRLYLIWHYSTTVKTDLVDKNWKLITQFFNLIPNSHDWTTASSWDCYSGLRIGNGLQESGIIHAGAAAFARMAHQRGEYELRDFAAYFSVMEIIGMQGALSANDYLRQCRPWSASNLNAASMEWVEKNRKSHYVEFNEFAGFSPNVIMAELLLNHPNSFIMTTLPEIMRPYQTVWPELTEDFFLHESVPFDGGTVKIDMIVYMMRNCPAELRLKALEARRDVEWLQKVADWRAALDAKGKISYRKLW